MIGIGIVVLSVWGFGGRLVSWSVRSTGGVLTPIVERIVRARSRLVAFISRYDLIVQQQSLQDQLTRARAQLAQQDDLQRELAVARAAVGIRIRTGSEPIEAGIVSYPQEYGTPQIVVNRGSDDWVIAGDSVITPAGAFIGVVDRVYPHHAIVHMIGDTALEITVRILGTNVSGILRAERSGALMIDLVQKDEVVPEGAVVVTSGDDMHPAGLVVGTVRSVNNDAATVFQIVRVSPEIADAVFGRVLIIRP